MHSGAPARNAPRLALALAVLAAALAAALCSAPAHAAVEQLYAGIGPGFEEFTQINTANGALSLTSERRAAGAYAAEASFAGGSGNGYARGLWHVRWQPGETVSYGAFFYLPKGFHAAMQGQVSLMRWDNYGSAQQNTDRGGIAIFGADKQAYLVRTRDGVEQVPLIGPFELPEGRWFELAVVQHLGASDAMSRVHLDDRLIGTSTAPNSYGRVIDRIRYGIVAIDSGKQKRSLSLLFDEAWVKPGSYQPPAPEPPVEEPPAEQPPGGSGPDPAEGPETQPQLDRRPQVAIVKPKHKAKVKAKTKLRIRAEASDDHGVKVVHFLIDGKRKHSDRKAPYTWRWKSAGKQLRAGKHKLRVVAVDTAARKRAAEITLKRVKRKRR